MSDESGAVAILKVRPGGVCGLDYVDPGSPPQLPAGEYPLYTDPAGQIAALQSEVRGLREALVELVSAGKEAMLADQLCDEQDDIYNAAGLMRAEARLERAWSAAFAIVEAKEPSDG